MSWYNLIMPTVKDVAPHIQKIAEEIKCLKGVQSVWVCGSYLEHEHQPDYSIKDIDIIAQTKFDSGDLMAIDDGKYSPLKLAYSALEDEGFDPEAVAFTKGYLGIKKYNIDHWAISSDGKLLHWGIMPETVEDWSEIHKEAETYAKKSCGVDREALNKSCDSTKENWYKAYQAHTKRYVNKKNSPNGWYSSDHTADELLIRSKKLA